MTDAAIVALTESPLPLTWLNFSYCLDITDVGVAAVAAKCIKLVVRICLLQSHYFVPQANRSSFQFFSSVTTTTCTPKLSSNTVQIHACLHFGPSDMSADTTNGWAV